MTLYDVFERLRSLDRTASSLLLDTGFQSPEGLAFSVCPLQDEAEDAFLRGQAEELLELLERLHKVLRCLKRPPHGAFTLKQLQSGRYGYSDKDGKEHSFTCGKPLEAKVYDPYHQPRWVRTRIEHNGSDYFLWNYPSIALSGLTVRERG